MTLIIACLGHGCCISHIICPFDNQFVVVAHGFFEPGLDRRGSHRKERLYLILSSVSILQWGLENQRFERLSVIFAYQTNKEFYSRKNECIQRIHEKSKILLRNDLIVYTFNALCHDGFNRTSQEKPSWAHSHSSPRNQIPPQELNAKIINDRPRMSLSKGLK